MASSEEGTYHHGGRSSGGHEGGGSHDGMGHIIMRGDPVELMEGEVGSYDWTNNH